VLCGFVSTDKNRRPGIDWFDVLKWILIVLAAGFVGQFGRRLADWLVSRRRDRRARSLSSPPGRPLGETGPENESGDAGYERKDAGGVDATTAAKIAKKAGKAEAKRKKKAPF
jgi:hypothetical protein